MERWTPTDKIHFTSLFFGADQPRMNDGDYRRFADCFVAYEEREDEDSETYTVAIPSQTLKRCTGTFPPCLGGSPQRINPMRTGSICWRCTAQPLFRAEGTPAARRFYGGWQLRGADGGGHKVYRVPLCVGRLRHPPRLTVPAMCAGLYAFRRLQPAAHHSDRHL
ncbi:MAG: hypothetical protein ACLSHA_11160 [Neglectibacter timonensis]